MGIEKMGPCIRKPLGVFYIILLYTGLLRGMLTHCVENRNSEHRAGSANLQEGPKWPAGFFLTLEDSAEFWTLFKEKPMFYRSTEL